jgi:hypothetical protein
LKEDEDEDVGRDQDVVDERRRMPVGIVVANGKHIFPLLERPNAGAQTFGLAASHGARFEQLSPLLINEPLSSRDNVAKPVREVKEYFLASHVPNPRARRQRRAARTFSAKTSKPAHLAARWLSFPASFSYICGARFHSAGVAPRVTRQ